MARATTVKHLLAASCSEYTQHVYVQCLSDLFSDIHNAVRYKTSNLAAQVAAG